MAKKQCSPKAGCGKRKALHEFAISRKTNKLSSRCMECEKYGNVADAEWARVAREFKYSLAWLARPIVSSYEDPLRR